MLTFLLIMGDLLTIVGLQLNICNTASSIISSSCSHIHGLTGVIIKDVILSDIFFYKSVLHSYTYLSIIKLPFKFKL